MVKYNHNFIIIFILSSFLNIFLSQISEMLSQWQFFLFHCLFYTFHIVFISFHIFLFNYSIVKDLFCEFQTLYCSFSMTVYLTCEFAIRIVNGVKNDSTLLLITDCMQIIVRSMTVTTLLCLDALSMEFATPRYRFFFLFFLLIGVTYQGYQHWMGDLNGNFQISISNEYKLDVKSVLRATYSTLATFIFKNTILCFIYPDNFKMLSASLQRANNVQSDICCPRAAS